jgi:hypothetical protein
MDVSELIKSSGLNPIQMLTFIQELSPKIPQAVEFVKNFLNEKEKELKVDKATEMLLHSFVKTGSGDLMLIGFVIGEKDGDTVVLRTAYSVNVVDKVNEWKDKLPF